MEDATEITLEDWERDLIKRCAQVAQILGLPPSWGEIYGYLFCRDEGQSFDQIVQGLGISKGSASQGCNGLKEIGAIRLEKRLGCRKTLYRAELRLRELVTGLIDKRLGPRLREAGSGLVPGDGDFSELGPSAEEKLLRFHQWHTQIQEWLPLMRIVFSGQRGIR